MKICVFMTLAILHAVNGFSECNIGKPNDILEKIKKNHPQIAISTAKRNVLEKSIEQAGQRPNPELDVESTVGDSIEGDVYKTAISLKHTFELGGKRDSRIQVAKNTLRVEEAFARNQNQDAIIDSVLKLHRLRQVTELIPLYEESIDAFNKILRSIRKRRSLSPEQQVESETLGLVVNDYRLKVSQLNSDKINLTKHISFFVGPNCVVPKRALPKNINLSETFAPSINVSNYSKLNAALSALELAKSNLELEKSNSYPNLQIGPIYEYEKLNVSKVNTFGVGLTTELPLFNVNSGGRARASKEVLAANLNLRYVKQESILDVESWVSKYHRYKSSLETIADEKKLEEKHAKIEALFKRGIISTSLVIESHRQLIEFFNTKFEFENGATEALWNIYKLNGELESKKL